ncbi:MAG: transposase [Candidatus Aramenus sp.]|jgi:transposase|nr:transposase [Candidatus Aramenus sp.]
MNSIVVHGERDSVEKPKGDKIASIDLGVNALATVVVESLLFYFTVVQQLRANFYFSGEDR